MKKRTLVALQVAAVLFIGGGTALALTPVKKVESAPQVQSSVPTPVEKQEAPKQEEIKASDPAPVEQPKIVAAPVEISKSPTGDPTPSKLGEWPWQGNTQDWLNGAGLSQDKLRLITYIFNNESSMRPDAVNSNGCIGLGQACPGGAKANLIAACPNWNLDPICQFKFFDNYATTRYGGWGLASEFWTQNHWW